MRHCLRLVRFEDPRQSNHKASDNISSTAQSSSKAQRLSMTLLPLTSIEAAPKIFGRETRPNFFRRRPKKKFWNGEKKFSLHQIFSKFNSKDLIYFETFFSKRAHFKFCNFFCSFQNWRHLSLKTKLWPLKKVEDSLKFSRTKLTKDCRCRVDDMAQR